MQNEYTDGWIKIIDNFVPQTTFNRLNENILSAGFPWYWTDTDYNTEDADAPDTKELVEDAKKRGALLGTFMHTHVVWVGTEHREQSQFWPFFECVMDEFKNKGIPVKGKYPPEYMLKVKLNSYTNRGAKYELVKHTDFYEDTRAKFGETKKTGRFNFCSAILYCNTCNGPTYIERMDGTTQKVDAVANRCVIFDGRLRHWAETQTDVDRRVIWNMNLRWNYDGNKETI